MNTEETQCAQLAVKNRRRQASHFCCWRRRESREEKKMSSTGGERIRDVTYTRKSNVEIRRRYFLFLSLKLFLHLGSIWAFVILNRIVKI